MKSAHEKKNNQSIPFKHHIDSVLKETLDKVANECVQKDKTKNQE